MREVSLLNEGEFKGLKDREQLGPLVVVKVPSPGVQDVPFRFSFSYFPHWDWSSSFTYCSIRNLF